MAVMQTANVTAGFGGFLSGIELSMNLKRTRLEGNASSEGAKNFELATRLQTRLQL